jgi:bacteriorhodopsin
MSSEVKQEKDYFWFYVGGLIVAVIVVLLMVKGSEHEKYATAAKAIAEDSANSAYLQK